MSISSVMSSIGRSLSGLGQSILNLSPKGKAILAGAAVTALAIGYLATTRNSPTPPAQLESECVAIISNESSVLPSDIFVKKASRADGTNLYQKGTELVAFVRSGATKEEVAQALLSMKLDPQEAQQVLALAKMEFPNEKGSPFHMLSELKQEINFQNAPAKAPENSPSPRQVSLREGELPPLDPKFTENLIAYLQGTGTAAAIGITSENYQEVLTNLKIFDLQLDRNPSMRRNLGLTLSTYELRTSCLVESKGKMPSFEAYTKSIDRKYFENPFSATSREYASREENYVPERVAIHAQLVMRYVADMTGLSRRFNNDEPTLYALSGNTAVGKSFMAKNDEEFMRGVDESGEATGALNPDTVKALLRKDVDGVTNQQIHIEGFALNRKLADELHSKALQTSMVIDERLGTVAATADLIQMARSSGKQLVIKDIDAPLKVSALRVLGRGVNTDPCVPFGPIAGGYKAIRKERADVIKMMVASPEVKSYELYVMDETGRSGLAARKVPGTDKTPATLEILDESLFAYALSGEEKAERDIQELKDAQIGPSLYEPFAGKGVKTEPLLKYTGCSVEEALMQHSLELPKWNAVQVTA